MTKARDLSLAAKAPLASPSFTGGIDVSGAIEASLPAADVLKLNRATANGDTNLILQSNGADTAKIHALSVGDLAFHTGASGSLTEKMRIDAAGIVTKPLQPAFMGLSATATNLAIQTWHTIVFSSERFDNNNDFSSNTFTAPVTGKYQMNVFIRLHSIDNAGHYYFIDLNTSNAHYYHIHGANGWSADPDYHTIGSSYVIDMDVGDTANVRLYQASGSAQTDIQANEGYFSGVLVA